MKYIRAFFTRAVRALKLIHTSTSSTKIVLSQGRGIANQNRVELAHMIQLLRQLRPTTVMEIGMGHGGTIPVLAQIAMPNAHLIGLDLQMPKDIDKLFKGRLKSRQKLSLIEADSHAEATKEKVLNLLAGSKIDFLFIDGDHSYEGVKSDFEDFSSMVRPGGLVGFHDIVPDYSVCFGIQTGAYSGEVYKFWRELISRFPHYEFIDSVGQNGYGIGVIRI